MHTRILVLVAVVISIGVVALVGFASRPQVESVLYGDVDCNGRVTAVDALYILQYEAGMIGYLPCLHQSDANADGQINVLDAALVLQLDARIIGSIRPTPVSPPISRPMS